MLRRARRAVHVRLIDVVERATAGALEPLLAEQARRQDEALDVLRAEIHDLRAEMAGLHDELRAYEIRERRDMLAAGERVAVESSARFVRDAMRGARTFPHPTETLDHAIGLAPTGGLALEFGVYSGTTLRAIAAARDGGVYGFDSFEGLPEDWRAGFLAEAFSVETPPDVPGADLVVGWFADTLPGFLESHDGPVDLLHLDADLYSSTVTVLDAVGHRLQPGSVVVFDDYLNHPGWEEGVHKAWTEWVERTGTDFTYEAFTHDNEQVVIIVR